MVRIVHYLNQFFAGRGGEEAARTPPVRIPGAVGPGKAAGVEIAATLACGDDYFGEHEDEALAALLGWLSAERPHVLLCGPSFGSGRYGYACGILAGHAARLGIPAVCGMHPESPGVAAAEGAAYIVPATHGVSGMREALPRMAALAARLAAGEKIGPPEAEGYLPRGLRRNEQAPKTGAARAIDLLLGKLEGRTASEVAGGFDRVPPPAPVGDLSKATLALVTEAGLVPKGNPDRLPSSRSRSWLRYPLDGEPGLSAELYETVHGGFDVTWANEDPNRLVPLDAVRSLVSEGRIGRLHGSLYTTTGGGTMVAAATKFGREIADDLKAGGVGAVLMTGT
jgi:glycine reductase